MSAARTARFDRPKCFIVHDLAGNVIGEAELGSSFRSDARLSPLCGTVEGALNSGCGTDYRARGTRPARRLRQAMTLASIDRLVHHATILEINVESYRRREALDRKRGRGRPATHATIKKTEKSED